MTVTRFAAEALRAGAEAVLVEGIPDGVDPARALVVADTLRALGDLAAYTRRRWGGACRRDHRQQRQDDDQGDDRRHLRSGLAAGSVRRWRTGRARREPDARPGRVLKTHGNENNLIGLPLTLLRLAGDEAWRCWRWA